MQHFYKIILLFIFFANSIAYSKNTHILDKNERYLITEINVTGNKITKATVIFRELSFKKNDLITIDEIDSKIQSSRYNLTNLNLFNFITIEYVITDENIKFFIEVIERWYVSTFEFCNAPLSRKTISQI